MAPGPVTDLDDVAEALGLTELRRLVEDVKGIAVDTRRRLDAIAERLGIPAQPPNS